MIWGSDWPVCTLAATCGNRVEAPETLAAHLSDAERRADLGTSALRACSIAAS